MKKIFSLGVVATGLAIAGTLITEVKPADAFVTHNGWNYSMDAKNDSTTFRADGSGPFEIYGSAYKVIAGQAYFAINSNVDLEDGTYWSSASNQRVDFSDILLNFTGKSLDDANGELFGIHFAENNDSTINGDGMPALGIYSNVTATSVSAENSGWSSLTDYNNYVQGRGVTPSIGDLVYDDAYFKQDQLVLNSIESGTKIGDISFVDDLSSIGLDFDNFGQTGSETIGFSFDASLLGDDLASALYHFGVECNNDLVAGYYSAAEVPTPAAILPTILGMFGAASRKKKEEKEEA